MQNIFFFKNKRESQTADVEIYCTALCPFCKLTRALFEKKRIKYTQYQIDKNEVVRAEMELRSGRKTVPQIFINKQHVGGWENLSRLEKEKQLDSLLGKKESGNSVMRLLKNGGEK